MNEFVFTHIKPTALYVEKEKDGTPYLWYEGITYLPKGQKIKIIIPHLSMELGELSIQRNVEEFCGCYLSKVVPSITTQNSVVAFPAEWNGEQIFFVVKIEENKEEENFSYNKEKEFSF